MAAPSPLGPRGRLLSTTTDVPVGLLSATSALPLLASLGFPAPFPSLAHPTLWPRSRCPPGTLRGTTSPLTRSAEAGSGRWGRLPHHAWPMHRRRGCEHASVTLSTQKPRHLPTTSSAVLRDFVLWGTPNSLTFRRKLLFESVKMHNYTSIFNSKFKCKPGKQKVSKLFYSLLSS